MSNRASRVFAGLETTLIALPVTLISFMGWMLIDISGPLIESPTQRFVFSGLILIAPVLCACGGILVGALALGGPEALRRTSTVIWAGMYAGAALTASGFLREVGRHFQIEQVNALDSHFGVFVLGAPMLIPAAHVIVARLRGANRT